MSRSITLPASLDEQVLRYQTVRWLLALLSVVVLPWFVFLPAWLVAYTVGVLLWRLAVNEWYFKLPRLWYSLIFALGVFALYFMLQNYELRLHLAVIAVLLVFSAFVLSMRSHRDSILVILLAFMLVGSAVLFSDHQWINVYMLLGSTAMTFALLLLTRYQLPVIPRRLLAQSLGLFLSALPVAMLLFLVFPSISKPLFTTAATEDGRALTGISHTISPGAMTEIVRSDDVVFRVQFKGEHPDARDLYWRGPVFWDYDGEHWHIVYDSPSMQIAEAPETSSLSLIYDYSVYFTPRSHRWIFPLDVPQHSVIGTYLTADQQLLLEDDIINTQQFDLRSVPRRPSQASTLTEFMLSGEDREQALALSVEYGIENMHIRSRALVKRWQEQANNDEELLNLALNFFKYGNFSYSLNPEAWPNLGGIDAFLFDTREGFCEHFSISFAFLMRLAGIPTRIVSGYQGGDYNALADYYVIRESDAHSWVEVWLEGKGWLRYDVVEYIISERIQSGMSEALISGDILHAENKLGYSLHYTRLMIDTVAYYWQRFISYVNAKSLFYFNEVINYSILLFVFLSALSVLFIIWVFYVLVLRFPRVEEKNELREIYALFCERLAGIHFPREEHETPMSYARRVIRKRPDLEESLLTIILLYNTCRYSNKPNVQLLEKLRQSVKTFRPTEKL